MNCQICEQSSFHKVLSLGHHAPVDNFLSKDQLSEPETHYPVDVYLCDNCKLVQLGYVVDPKELFTHSFVYTTGSSGELVENFKELVGNVVKRFHLSDGDLAVDVGSNDGTLLENYLPHNVKVLGVDPSEAAKLAAEKNVPTLLEFFNEETAGKIKQEHGNAKIITATNVFAHIKELASFMNGVRDLLTEDGVFIEESHYLRDLIENMEYDSIYSEHLRYYSLKPLIALFERFGMQVFDAERIGTHGGSLRVYACKPDAYPPSENMQRILAEEEKAGLYSPETFDAFAKRVEQNRAALRSLLFKLKAEGNQIVGIGAPAKGNTLLNYCGIGKDTLDYIVEKPNLKIGKFSPGAHIPVIEETQMFEDQPPYALLLAWNLKRFIIPKIKKNGFKGKIIVPVPTPHIEE